MKKVLLLMVVSVILICILSGCNAHIHKYTDVTCTSPKICEECGKIAKEALGHKYTDATCTSASVCSRCKSVGRNALGHDFIFNEEDTCTSYSHCSRCGLTSGEMRGHMYIDATCTTSKVCTRCNYVAHDALGHDFSSSTCTSAQICKRCGEKQGMALGHDYSEATCNAPKTCKRCGGTDGVALGHTYAENICIRCGQIDPESLPVGLDKLYLIDNVDYSCSTDSFTDTYGNIYNEAVHIYKYTWLSRDGFSIHNLDSKYSSFSGSLVAGNDMHALVTVKIYVDDVLKFSTSNFSRDTGKIDFEIDVSNAKKLKIVVKSTYNSKYHIAIVNAELIK